MIKREQQVCSFELAKKLKESGAKQESNCYWSPSEVICCKIDNPTDEKNLIDRYGMMTVLDDTYCSAFTMEELIGIFYD